jgi:hypothetical protein
MASLTLRLVKGSPLTNTELDGNFTALNNELATKLNNTYAAMVATLGFTPYDAANPAGYITSSASITGSAATLTTGRTIALTGDVTYTSGSFNGSANVTGTATLAASGVTAGTYTKITVDAKGRATSGGSIASSDVTTALGFTPYNATNPSGYITSSALSGYLPLGGGTLTGALAVGGDLSATGILYTRAANNPMSGDSNANFEVRNSSGTGDSALAMMRFHCQGAYGIKLGLRADGYFGLGGWSRAAWSWYSAPDGSMVAAGNVTAYSDEKLKKNWRDLPADFIEQLAQVKYGIYDRIDEDGLTQVGVSAQSLRNAMPHAVMKGLDDTLTVAYGNAALTAAVALSQRVIAQEARISELERIAAL